MLLSMGHNKKLSKKIAIFNLPAILTCPSCNDCHDTCYAVQAETQHPQTRKQRLNNLKIATEMDSEIFIQCVIDEVIEKRAKIVRLHESGDFFNDSYIFKWYSIIRELPEVQFYGYTKVEKAYDSLNELSNCNLIYSYNSGHLNYGTEEYIKMWKKETGGYICRLEKGQRCMEDCNYCLTGNTIWFPIHGRRKGE